MTDSDPNGLKGSIHTNVVTPQSGIIANSSPDTTSSGTKQIESSAKLLEEPQIKKILISDSSFEILLYRLKQSIKSCDEFANFIKRKHSYEESYARDLRKTASTCKSSIRSNCVFVKDSFIDSLRNVINYDERMVADVRRPYIKALETMYDELSSLGSTFARLRKQLKEEGSRKEKEVMDAISQAEKSRNKYQSVCADLEKLRNSDQSQKKITLQGRKTGPQQEEELNRKLHSADADYNKKAYYSQKCKNELIETVRPRIANHLKELILELDHALQMQLSKYAVFCESLVIGMGNQITPLGHNHTAMQEAVSSIDVERSLYNYIINSKVEHKGSFTPVEYKRHAVFGNLTADGSFARVGNTPSSRIVSGNSYISDPSPANTSQISKSFIPHSTSPYRYGNDREVSNASGIKNTIGLNGPRPLSESSISQSNSANLVQSQRLSNPSVHQNGEEIQVEPKIPNLGPNANNEQGKLFGISIDKVPHDDEMVPLFVKKSIYILDKYGVNTEGIYRSSPNKIHMEQLKEIVDRDPEDLSVLDPPNPESITNDYICVIASLLKKFFAMLPEPLLTFEQTENFLKAGQIEDIKTMHLQLHRIVFELPDANYFTLRDLLFHFIHISQIPRVRMSVRNLAIVWSNNLFTQNSDSGPEQLHLKQRVIEELIHAAPDIFNPIENNEG